MRQTISKDHSNETLIQNQAIIIGAHCNSKIRKERCLKLLQEVKNRFGDDYLIIFCSHLPIETEFYDYVNYAIYNKNNPQINYDIIDQTTAWKCFTISQPAKGHQLYKPVQTSDYSHYLQVVDGFSLAVTHNVQKIHYFSYDVIFEVLDKINEHNNYLDDYDGVSYSFVNDNHMSSEFFSITNSTAKNTLCKTLSLNDYVMMGNGDFGHETVYFNMFKTYNFKRHKFFHQDGREEAYNIGDFATMPLNTENNISKLPSKLNGIVIIPYVKDDEIKICIANNAYKEHDGEVKLIVLKFTDENDQFTNVGDIKDMPVGYWGEIYPDDNARYCEVIVDDTSWLKFDLKDKKNFGYASPL